MGGTPLYMSPEGAKYNNLYVDTRTDILSLKHRRYLAATQSPQKLHPHYVYLWWVNINAFAPEAKPIWPAG